jgi:hypothetical protein
MRPSWVAESGMVRNNSFSKMMIPVLFFMFLLGRHKLVAKQVPKKSIYVFLYLYYPLHGTARSWIF